MLTRTIRGDRPVSTREHPEKPVNSDAYTLNSDGFKVNSRFGRARENIDKARPDGMQ